MNSTWNQRFHLIYYKIHECLYKCIVLCFPQQDMTTFGYGINPFSHITNLFTMIIKVVFLGIFIKKNPLCNHFVRLSVRVCVSVCVCTLDNCKKWNFHILDIFSIVVKATILSDILNERYNNQLQYRCATMWKIYTT